MMTPYEGILTRRDPGSGPVHPTTEATVTDMIVTPRADVRIPPWMG